MPQVKKILLRIPQLHAFDAASTDLLLQAKVLREQGCDVWIQARSYPKDLTENILTEEQALELARDKEVTIVSHFCGFDRKLSVMREACQGQFFLRYHNVTPPKWFVPYAWRSFLYALVGRCQAWLFLWRQKADALLPASQFSARELLKRIPQSKQPPIFCIPVLAQYDSFAPARELRQPETPLVKRALFVGRVVPSKGLVHLVELLRAWRGTESFRRGCRLHVTIVGKITAEFDPYQRDLLNLARSYHVFEDIHFVNAVSAQALLQQYAQADIFVCPSEHEGFGVPLIEAQYARLPLVAIDRGAVKETIGEGGICISGHTIDYVVFARAVEKILADPEFREDLVNKGLKNTQRFRETTIKDLLVKALSLA